jgi:hypothetical protein
MAAIHAELEDRNLNNLRPYEVNVDPMIIQQIENERDKTKNRLREVIRILNDLDRKLSNTTDLGKKAAIINRKRFYLGEEERLRELYTYYNEQQKAIGAFDGGRRSKTRRLIKRSKSKKSRRHSRRR